MRVVAMFYDDPSTTTQFVIFGWFTNVRIHGNVVRGESPEHEDVDLATISADGRFVLASGQTFDTLAVRGEGATDPAWFKLA